MATKIDFLVNDVTGDILIQNGDLVIGDATKSQAKSIIIASKGEFRQYPLLGVSLNAYLGSSSNDDILYNAVKTELEKDDIELLTFEVTREGNNLTIDLEVQ